MLLKEVLELLAVSRRDRWIPGCGPYAIDGYRAEQLKPMLTFQPLVGPFPLGADETFAVPKGQPQVLGDMMGSVAMVICIAE